MEPIMKLLDSDEFQQLLVVYFRRVSPNSGNYIAKGKGVHREVESERSRRQTSDLTYRNFI